MPSLLVYYPQPDDELEVLSYVGAAMQAALPERYRKANVTLVDRLTTMADCLKNGQLFFPVGDMNFTRNCTATVSYCSSRARLFPADQQECMGRDHSVSSIAASTLCPGRQRYTPCGGELCPARPQLFMGHGCGS